MPCRTTKPLIRLYLITKSRSLRTTISIPLSGEASALNSTQAKTLQVFLVFSQEVSPLLFIVQALNRELSKLVINHFYHDLNLNGQARSSDNACDPTCS